MTSKIYKTAQGKTVDLGTIMLQNEHVRAVGNMNVNARGDKLDSNNQVIETKSRQVQRQSARTTNVSAEPVHTSSAKARRANQQKVEQEVPVETPVETPVVDEQPIVDLVESPPPQAVAPPAAEIGRAHV